MVKPVRANVRFKTLCLRADAMYVCIYGDDGRELMLPMQRHGRALWSLETLLPLGVYHYHFGRKIDGRLTYHRPFDARVPVSHGQSARLEVTPGCIQSVRRWGQEDGAGRSPHPRPSRHPSDA